jgi:hypothetical protein
MQDHVRCNSQACSSTIIAVPRSVDLYRHLPVSPASLIKVCTATNICSITSHRSTTSITRNKCPRLRLGTLPTASATHFLDVVAARSVLMLVASRMVDSIIHRLTLRCTEFVPPCCLVSLMCCLSDTARSVFLVCI